MMSNNYNISGERRRRSMCLRTALAIFIFLIIFYHINSMNITQLTAVNLNLNESNLDMLVSTANSITIGDDSTVNISEIKRNIGQCNMKQTIYNENIFDPLQNDSIVIVIQIHNRITYLRHLIASLARVREISQSLVIFSHDYYDYEINQLVQSIDFCKVMQIFYPYSIQTHPHNFPGEDPNDCPRNIDKKQASLKGCNNALNSDLYGHYREAAFTQTKHHWWWKANTIFNRLEYTKNHGGLVLFLEEDHYVTEDFIYILNLMASFREKNCISCNILSLGSYRRTFIHYEYAEKVEITPWICSRHNMGMAFNRTTWMDIVGCSDEFCKYDDYNWDWSLQYISQNCLKYKLRAMVVRGPRVFHIGECGVHHKKNNCEAEAVIAKIEEDLKAARKYSYPNHLTLTYRTLFNMIDYPEPSGGWGDPRDHELCISMSL